MRERARSVLPEESGEASQKRWCLNGALKVK